MNSQEFYDAFRKRKQDPHDFFYGLERNEPISSLLFYRQQSDPNNREFEHEFTENTLYFPDFSCNDIEINGIGNNQKYTKSVRQMIFCAAEQHFSRISTYEFECSLCHQRCSINEKINHIISAHSKYISELFELNCTAIDQDNDFLNGFMTKLQFDSILSTPTIGYPPARNDACICAPPIFNPEFLHDDSDSTSNSGQNEPKVSVRVQGALNPILTKFVSSHIPRPPTQDNQIVMDTNSIFDALSLDSASVIDRSLVESTNNQQNGQSNNANSSNVGNNSTANGMNSNPSAILNIHNQPGAQNIGIQRSQAAFYGNQNNNPAVSSGINLAETAIGKQAQYFPAFNDYSQQMSKNNSEQQNPNQASNSHQNQNSNQHQNSHQNTHQHPPKPNSTPTRASHEKGSSNHSGNSQQTSNIPSIPEEILSFEDKDVRKPTPPKKIPKYVPYLESIPKEIRSIIISNLAKYFMRNYASSSCRQIVKPVLQTKKKQHQKKVREEKAQKAKNEEKMRLAAKRQRKESAIQKMSNDMVTPILRSFIRSEIEMIFKQEETAIKESKPAIEKIEQAEEIHKAPPPVVLSGLTNRRHLDIQFLRDLFANYNFQLDEYGEPKIRFRFNGNRCEVLLYFATVQDVLMIVSQSPMNIEFVTVTLTPELEDAHQQLVSYAGQEVKIIPSSKYLDNFYEEKGQNGFISMCPVMCLDYMTRMVDNENESK
ncbi:hypothetical protein TRFO_12405 [Tritrichomonas foetus]|uniref:Uncharacterized protein n=1 Tax=Tritrichomonas foetus TaxID=1144522 RepID=A0A1J4L2X4_9EUKA|nr:hypothetical protein TRFO_12405 [Tritrichomonas foetus]|eukprot:OHT17440.1 hypothetical protein TRFO_12405 [Tritrichomonas foetus]